MSGEVQVALIGTLVGGLIELIGAVLLAAIFESRRLQAEGRRRDVEWRREKCNEAYSQAIYYLFKLQLSSVLHGTEDDVHQHLSEAQRYRSLLQAYHPLAVERKKLSLASGEAASRPRRLPARAGA